MAGSLLTFLTELEEERDLLEEKASLEPRRCLGVESMISQTVTPVPCGRKGRVKRGDSVSPGFSNRARRPISFLTRKEGVKL